MPRSVRLIASLLVSVHLCGCAVDANIGFVPDFMKQPGPRQPVAEAPPDLGRLLQGNLSAVFLQGSSPTNIRFSPPVAGKYGGWDTCVKGEVVGVTGQPLGVQTFLVNIDQERVGRRERVDAGHWCARESYKPI
ncbi:hypothetical protein ACTZWT_19750 [Rhodopseudomonas sp. NSM]|uniref:hypothetical protein n=1 Tax=Rhodopseudomonas sp. NSM TaxID=3457630 RepID=UPI004036A4BE